jgi:hypothetical protein
MGNKCMRRIFSLLPVMMLTVLAACGSSSATTSSVTTTTTPTTTKACLSVTTGTIQSISNNNLQVTSLQGKKVQVMVTSATMFIRQATLTAADLKTGLLVTIMVKQNADNTYSALTVSVRTSLTRQGSFGSGNGATLCSGQRRGFGSGTPGAFSGGTNRQTINGTVSQINGNSLTVTDTSGNDFTVTVTATTRMTEQQSVTASDLQTGEAVTITGSANSQGVITASSVSLLQTLPTRR